MTAPGVALLFPGQGAQRRGMFRDLPTGPAATTTLDAFRAAVAAAVGGDEHTLDDGVGADDPVAVQLALLGVGVVHAAALHDDLAVPVDAVAGDSVGAFAAAVTAGVLSVDTAVRAVAERARTMAAVVVGRDWVTAAVDGVAEGVATRALAAATTATDPVWLAGVTAPDQVTVTGTAAAAERLRPALVAAGARRWTVLTTPVPSHGPLQRPVADAVRATLGSVAAGEQTVPYVTNVGGRWTVRRPDLVLADLAAAVTAPVRWADTVGVLAERGVAVVVQAPPGSALTRLSTRSAAVSALAVADLGVEALAARVARLVRG